MKTALYITMMIAALVMVPILASVVTAQQSFDRELCLRNCNWLSPWGASNRGNYGGNYASPNYSSCVAGCENQFWNEFDRNTERLEQRLNEPD